MVGCQERDIRPVVGLNRMSCSSLRTKVPKCILRCLPGAQIWFLAALSSW